MELVEAAPIDTTPKGLRTAIEIIAYSDGQMSVSASRVSGPPGARAIVQVSSLMFNDAEEAKDAIDGIVDRLDVEAEKQGQAAVGGDGVLISQHIQEKLRTRGRHEVTAVEAAGWLDEASLLPDSRTRRGKPLRDLLRAGLIEGSEQRPARPWGRWYICLV
jgi:hypothetical protein